MEGLIFGILRYLRKRLINKTLNERFTLNTLSELKQGPLHTTVLVLQGELNEKLLHCTYKLQIVRLHSLCYVPAKDFPS